ncbi:MAG: ABC transporter permease [Acidobacteriia bacterium]|nr:ABC transporter permease [Terriglobia bacterium]
MDSLLQDLRFAVRMFAKNPGLTLIAVFSLSLAIGPNSALFSAVDAVLLSPPPIQQPDQIVGISTRVAGQHKGISYPEYLDLRDQTSTLAGVLTWQNMGALLDASGTRELVPLAVVSENYFSLSGAKAAAGRTLLPKLDEIYEGAPPIVISYSLWQRSFATDPEIVGKTIILTGKPFRIVGVAERGFKGLDSLIPTDIWLPVSALSAMDPSYKILLLRRDEAFGAVWGRLRPGINPEQARLDLTRILNRVGEPQAKTLHERQAVLWLVAPDQARRGIVLGSIVLALVGLVLLIACANVANLQLAQSEMRRRETAIRLALGATRLRLMRQWLTESALLSIMGTGLGLLLGYNLIQFLSKLKLPVTIPLDFDIRLNSHVLGYTLFLAFVTTILFGLSPALRASKPNLVPELKSDDAVVMSHGYRRMPLRNVLVIGQIAVSQLLLAGGGLLLRSYLNITAVRPGFDSQKQMLLVTTIPDEAAPGDYSQVVERIHALPRVRRVSYCSSLPMSGMGEAKLKFSLAGMPALEDMAARFSRVGPGYFETMGTHVLRGRGLETGDARPDAKAVLINEELSRRLKSVMHDEDPVGRWIRIENEDHLVVGVVEDGKYGGLREPPQPFLYLPYDPRRVGEAVLLIETGGDANLLAAQVRRTLSQQNSPVQIVTMTTLREHMRLPRLADEMSANLVGTLGLLGMFMASVGLCGLMFYLVNRRTHEIGVRMALGAESFDVLQMIMGQGLRLTLSGVLIGLALAFLVGRIVAGLLFGISSSDPIAFGGSTLVVTAIAAAAIYAPARKAVRVDPIVALRHE